MSHGKLRYTSFNYYYIIIKGVNELINVYS